MIPVFDGFWLLPFFLYAEMHYRFRYFVSFLRKKEPELIADAPHRLEPGQPLPLLILAKDGHIYPSRLQQIQIVIRQEHRELARKDLLTEPISINTEFWWRTFTLDVSGWYGWLTIEVSLKLQRAGKTKTYQTDNYRTSSHKPLRVFVADQSLPRYEGLHFGETHTHSTYTSDQVEFGAPLESSAELAKAMGLSFFCVTDHSYDLDDSLNSYLVNDPAIPKWGLLRSEVDTINGSASDFVILRGEEISCRNGAGQNVHLLLIGNERFFAGSGDGAERWLKTHSEHSIREILNAKENSSVAFAAHPLEHVPFLQKLLLGRGSWQDADMQEKSLSGLQIINGSTDEGFRSGYRLWRENLLRGMRQFIIAGNDAHGNFNRFRQVGIPFLKIKEMDRQIFGEMRTGVILNEPLTPESVLNALRKGRCIVTDGPVLQLRATPDNGEEIGTGEEAHERSVSVRVMALTTPEFGMINDVKIIRGMIGGRVEEILEEHRGINKERFESRVRVEASAQCYIRAEATTEASSSMDGESHFCLTNPIWILP